MIYALPGMGADRRVFPGAWQQVADVRFVEWTPYVSVRSISELAAAIADGEGIQDGDSLLGTSLGGMVACEVAKLRRIERLVLVASAVDRSEVSRLLVLLGPLAPLAPVNFIQAISTGVPAELARMFEGADHGFIRSMCRAIFAWDGPGVAHPGVIRIHGRSDPVIRCPAKADLAVDGGHLIAMTHAAECVAFLERVAPGVFRR